MRRLVPCFLAWFFLATRAFAVLPSEQLANPRLEARARAISQELRCVVCQNQSIDDSDATLAHDLRVIVRERLEAGESDDQVKAYIVRRYGPYVLLKPPLEPLTVLLWFGPFCVLVVGAAGAAVFLRRRSRLEARALDKDEEFALSQMLRGGRQ